MIDPETIRIETAAMIDTEDLAQIAANLGDRCDDCGAPWDHDATPTWGGRGKRLNVTATATCPECGHEAAIKTGVDFEDIEFDIDVPIEEVNAGA